MPGGIFRGRTGHQSADPAAQDRAGSVIELQALRALALAASGERPAEVAALAGALTLACPQGYVRVFADEGPPMAALLAGWSRRSGPARPPLGSRSAAWRGCCKHSTGRTPGRVPGQAPPPQRCRAWLSS